jgi:hypothetical protein
VRLDSPVSLPRFFSLVAGIVFSMGIPTRSDTMPTIPESNTSDRISVDLTVYNQGSSLIREVREVTLRKGQNRIVVPEVPATLDPSSMHLSTAGGTLRILEQNYQFDLPDTYTLLSRYIGRDIELMRKDGLGGERSFVAKLLAVENSAGMNTQGPDGRNAGILAEVGGKIEVAPAGRLVLPSLPEGLILKPRLLWLAETPKDGKQKVELTYLAGAINWTCEYVTLLSADATKIDLTGWVTLDNQSGTAFHNAGLKLVAGEVNRVEDQASDGIMEKSSRVGYAMSAPAAPQFQQSEIFEYKLYTLGRRTDLGGREKKQIELVSANQANCRKVMVYDGIDESWHWWMNAPGYRNQQNFGQTGNTKVGVYVIFKNDKASNLGMPLPAGRVRVFQNDPDGKPQLIGEDKLGHTPKDEEIRLFLGKSFDVVGERAQMDFKSLAKGEMVEETFRIKLRNHKASPAVVDILEHPWRWREWEVLKADAKWEKVDQNTLRFPVEIAADSEKVVTYTLRYRF